MRFAYLSTDEVNIALALAMAKGCGVTLNPLAPKDGLPDAAYDGVLCDWDSWPLEARDDLLAMLSAGSQPRRIAAHSYNLSDEQATAFFNKGFMVHRVLQPNIFKRLARAVVVAKRLQARQAHRVRTAAKTLERKKRAV
jgi:hypothetical protein